MRLLLIPWGQSSHYFHLVPLAWAARAAGHDVRVAAQPGAVNAVLASGLTVTRVGRDYDLTAATRAGDHDIRAELTSLRRQYLRPDRDPAPLARLRDLAKTPATTAVAERPSNSPATSGPLTPAAEAMAGDLVGLARSWRPDLVVADPLVLAAPIAAAAAGVPLVHHLFGPAVHRNVTGGIPGSGQPAALWAPALRQLYEQYGVAPATEAAVATIDTCPAGLQYLNIPRQMPMRYVPYNGPGAAPAWLLDPPQRPRICLTWGLLTDEAVGADGFLVPRILEALGDLGVEIVVTVGERERALLGDPPPHTRYVTNLPLHLLLPTCTAIVHQGGGGTMLTAAAYGLPQTTITVMTGHLLSARRLAATGAAVMLDAAEATTSAIRAAVGRALDDDTRAAARRLCDEIAVRPSPAEVVRDLAELSGAA